MSIYASNESKPRELVPSGNHVARCYLQIELGNVEEEFKGVKKIVPKVIIGWELPFVKKDYGDGKGPTSLTFTKEYTLFMNAKATLRKDLESWRGKAYTEEQAKKVDITRLLGQPCFLNIIHQPKQSDPSVMRDKVASITPMPKEFTAPDPIRPQFVLSFDKFDPKVFDSLPDFIKDKIRGSKEYKAMTAPPPPVLPATQDNTNQSPTFDKGLGYDPMEDLPF